VKAGSAVKWFLVIAMSSGLGNSPGSMIGFVGPFDHRAQCEVVLSQYDRAMPIVQASYGASDDSPKEGVRYVCLEEDPE
jgi:hypothetical protein